MFLTIVIVSSFLFVSTFESFMSKLSFGLNIIFSWFGETVYESFIKIKISQPFCICINI